ncbi:MAG: prolyl oligopeptidase family serine peptidase [Planctomycetota bacterium]|nr:prolyl oligopeptidase family serine peptidase [Planctomycetota bacterium]
MQRKIACFAPFGVALAVGFALAAGPKLEYPQTLRVDHYDEYHGTRVADPYRWLEDDVRESEQVAEWVAAQNTVTFSYLNSIPQREAIKNRLTKLWDYERYSAPFKTGGRYYYSKNDGLQNQSVVYMMDTLDGEPRVLFDPNTWSEDGTVALAGMAFSDDGRYVAYGIADAGSDWRRWQVRDLATYQDLPDVINWVKFSAASWTKDGKGFFYGRYDAPTEGDEFQAVNKFQKLYYHRLNTPQTDDVLVYHRPDQPDWFYGAKVTEDGRYLVITISKGTDDKYRIMYKDLSEPYGLPIDLIDNFDAEYSFVGNDGPVFFFKTDLDAPKGRLIAIDIRHPSAEKWIEVIAQSPHTLRGVNLVGNMFVARYLRDAVTHVRMFDVTGRHVRDIEFPALGSARGFGGKRSHTETFYSFSSFATPPSIYRFDMITGESELLRQADADFNPDDYTTRQVFYESADGTRVPMFLCHRKGLVLNGENPTLLYGYGGFNVSLTPYFSTTRLAWMEMGGVFAMPNLRGGGEYGVEWHDAGRLANKQNVFDDFIAAAEWLIANNYTRSDKLAIQGGSNGGLLVGACMTQRPELFGACLPAVGVMDMLRFHKFTIGWAWVDDYGSSDDREQFTTLLAYSPYHNVRDGSRYPATLITTADTDDRVVPGHSFKFAAAVQHAQAGDAPVLIRIETRAGHGAGTPTKKIIEKYADLWAFLAKTLEMSPQPQTTPTSGYSGR